MTGIEVFGVIYLITLIFKAAGVDVPLPEVVPMW